MELYLASEGETRRLAEKLGTILPPGGVTVGLIGELGAGKTKLIKYLAQSWGVPEAEVSSPSFVLQNIYQSRERTIEHWDLYRLSILPDELWEDAASGTVRLVEWPDKIPSLLAKLDLRIELHVTGPESRSVRLSAANAEFESLLKNSISTIFLPRKK